VEYDQVIDILSAIRGATFAAIDTDTMPKPGIRRVSIGEVVILFTNDKSSGYENMVRRRLTEVGKNPDDFNASALPWGTRVEGTPLIEHGGKFYLQTILLKEGKETFFIGSGPAAVEISREDYLSVVKPTDYGKYQNGLERAVVIRTYRLDHILELRIQHMKITATVV
jgi:hypothetical protein